jgi:hypothetical protein
MAVFRKLISGGKLGLRCREIPSSLNDSAWSCQLRRNFRVDLLRIDLRRSTDESLEVHQRSHRQADFTEGSVAITEEIGL